MNFILQATQFIVAPADPNAWTPAAVIKIIVELGVIIGAVLAYLKSTKADNRAVTATIEAKLAQVQAATANERVGNVSRATENVNTDVKGILLRENPSDRK